MSKFKLSFWKKGKAGLHLTINPQSSSLPPSARFYRRFLQHGIPLTDKQLRSLLAGREEGITTINNVLGFTPIVSELGANTRLKLSTQIADALMNHSLQGQLSREAPTALQRVQQRDQILKHIFQQGASSNTNRGSLPMLLQKVPVGVSITINF